MTKEVAKTAKAKSIQIFVGTELKAESNDRLEALEKLAKLQNENFPEIKIVYHNAKVSHLYIKGRYDKNYKLKGTEYVSPSKAVSEEAAAE
jgi:hypothetical protein